MATGRSHSRSVSATAEYARTISATSEPIERIMSEKIMRVYVDNSVVSGMFDDHMPERVAHMERFWQAMIDGKIKIIASDVLRDEMVDSPQHVREFFDDLPESQIERVKSTEESDKLALQYIAENVIGAASLDDCRHIAVATIAHADVVVSWNCDDMVNPNRVPKYTEVNKQHGYPKEDYPKIEIVTPDKFMEEYL